MRINEKLYFAVLRKICLKCYNKMTARHIRQRAIDALGTKCQKCGFDDPRALVIDHINGGGSIARRVVGVMTIYRQVLNTPDGFQILCANCNSIKRAEEKERVGACNHDELFLSGEYDNM